MKLAFRTGVNIFVSYFAMVLYLEIIETTYFLRNIIGVLTIPVVALIIVHVFNVLLNKVKYLNLSMDENLKSIKLGILILELYFIGRDFIRGFSVLNDDGLAFLCTIMLVLNIPLCNVILRKVDVSKDYWIYYSGKETWWNSL